MAKRILIVDDEPDVLELVGSNLRRAGFEVATAEDGREALEKAARLRPALVVLDVMLPGMAGTEVCKLLKRDPATASIPVIMLTARAEEIDRVVGLELGADDYVAKPFSPRELVLRVQSVLRRTEGAEARPALVQAGEITIDGERRQVFVRNEPIELTATEFKLLAALAKRRGIVHSREKLLNEVWGYETLIESRTVDTHMRRLRDKLGPAADCLETVRGFGYRMTEEG